MKLKAHNEQRNNSFPCVNSEEELVIELPIPSMPALIHRDVQTPCKGGAGTKTRNSLFKEAGNFQPVSEVSLPCLTQQQVQAKNSLVHQRLRPSDSSNLYYCCFE